MHKKRLAKMNIYLVCMCFASLTDASAFARLPQQVVPADTVKTIQLSDVTVVGRQRVSSTTQTVPFQAIDNEGIKRFGVQDLSEAVRRFSGVSVKDYGGIGGLKTVSIRSLGAHHTAVSYDGVSIADTQSGQVDISRFTLDNVEMVSLSSGSGDDIFQTARVYASAGTLHIKTLKPRFTDDKSRLLTAKLKGGSFGLFNPVLTYSRQWQPRWSTTIHADYMRADSKYPFTLVNGTIKTREKRINSDIETARIEANMYGDFGEAGGSLETKLYVFHSGRGLPGAVNFYTVSSNERLWNDNSFFQARYQNRLNEHFTIQTIAKYAYSRLRYRIKDDNYAAGFREDHNTQHEYYVSAGVLYTPLNCLSASLTTDYANTKLNNNFVNAAQPRRNTSLTAFAVQYKRDALTATGSLLGTYISDGVQNGDRPADRKHLSPAVAFSWRPYPNNALRIRASYKDIFRVPTFADLYYLRVGSAGLKPEKAKQYNAGLTWSGTAGHIFRHLSISIDGYYNRVSDKIVALPTLYIWRMMNMGTVEIKGVDINIATEIPLHTKINMTLSGNNTFQHAIDITHPEAKNYRNQIPYTPRNSGNGSVAFETPWVNVSYILTTVSERYALPQNTKANRLNAYTEQSIQMNRTFNTKHFSVRIQGEILNLADTQYDVIQYYPMPGRAWRLSLTLFN